MGSIFFVKGGAPMEDKSLYVIFSATPYRMGRLIRFVTGEPYNHVSIATEQDLRHMYAFARRYYRTPFYGGFVTEQPCRYHHNGSTAQIEVYQLPLSDRQWATLQGRLQDMQRNPHRYLYNHLSAALAPIHRKVTVPDAFTCAEFTVSILQELGFPFRANRFYTIGQIRERLSGFEIYQGEFPAPPENETSFFEPRPLNHPIYASTRDILKLFWRKAII